MLNIGTDDEADEHVAPSNTLEGVTAFVCCTQRWCGYRLVARLGRPVTQRSASGARTSPLHHWPSSNQMTDRDPIDG